MSEQTSEVKWGCGCHVVDGELVQKCTVGEFNKVCFRLRQEEEAKNPLAPAEPEEAAPEAPAEPSDEPHAATE